MNSKTLKEDGFADFHPLKELALMNMPDNEAHVFVLIDKTLSEKPTSDILYIGRAKKPIKKVFGGFIGGSGGRTVKKIHEALFNDSYIEKTSISWLASNNPKTTQRELLEKFRSIHGEYPPWNAPKKVSVKRKSEQEPIRGQRIRKPPAYGSHRSQ
jgi:hypothetical protein